MALKTVGLNGNSHWVDDNLNTWTVRDYSKQEALKLSKSLVSCIKCTNCSYCKDCVGCVDCVRCNECNLSTSCNSCRFCDLCYSCRACSGCTGCNKMVECNGCLYCFDCADCSECRHCNACVDLQGDRFKGIVGAVGAEKLNGSLVCSIQLNNRIVKSISLDNEGNISEALTKAEESELGLSTSPAQNKLWVLAKSFVLAFKKGNEK